MNIQTNDNGKTPGLIRGLGLWSSIAVVMGAMIGQSVFLVASDMSRVLGSVPKVLALWLGGGIVVLLGSLCFAELGAALPEAGGEYIYLSRGLGSLWGFLYGWTSSLIIKPGSAASMAAGLMRFAGFLFPAVINPLFTWNLSVPFQSQTYPFTFTSAQPLAAAVIVVITAINYFGVRTAGRLQVILTSFKVAVVISIILLGLTAEKMSGIDPVFIASTSHGVLQGFLIAVVPVLAAYSGFSYLGPLGGEIVDPRKNLSRAAILGTTAVIILYLLTNWTYFHVLGFARVAQSQHVASDAAAILAGGRGARWLTIALIISALGSLHANFLTGPRVPYAMAHDGLFFTFAKRVQPKFHSPGGAVIFQGCMAVLLVLTGTYQDLYSLTIFAVGIFYALAACALIRLRMTQPLLPRPYRAWGYPWTPVIFGAAALVTSLNLILIRPLRSAVGLAIMLLGIPFFRYWTRRASGSGLETGEKVSMG